METSDIPVEDNPVPKSTGSLIQISSIYIDLKIPKEKNETESCEHNFSIRGYAAEMRMNNPKASMPFASSDGNLKDIEGELPPMDVPKFRWWKCPECRRSISNNSATGEILPHSSCCGSLNVPNGDTPLLPGTQQVPAAQINENSNGTGDAAATGISTLPVEPESDKSVDIRGEEPATQIGNSIATTDDCSDDHIKRLEVAVPSAVNPFEVAPIQAEECGGASSESDQKKKHDNSSGASRRKRKVRYLTDLLGDNGNQRNDPPRQDGYSIQKVIVPLGTGTAVCQGQAPCVDVGKGSKSPQKADSDRTVTDIAISSSERHANASSGNKNDCSKRKTERNPAPVKRKNKLIQGQDKFSPKVAEKSHNNIILKENDQCFTTPSTMMRSVETPAAGRADNDSGSSPPAQELEREKSNVAQTSLPMSKHQLPAGLDLSLNCIPSSSKNILEKGNVPLAQCSIMPASEPDVQKNSQLLDLNQNSVVLEKRILPKEMSGHKEKASEGQVCAKKISKPSDQMACNRIARGSSDDIPMEIVELMAKNQYERGLADTGSQSFRNRMNNSVGRFPEVQGMGPLTQFVKGIPGLASFSQANARSGMAIGCTNAGADKVNAINYSQMNRKHFEVVQAEKNKVSIYNIFPQNQQVFSRRMQYPASSSLGSGSQPNERGEASSSSKSLNISFGLGMQQNYHAQNPEAQHKGKTISDIKADELKKTQEAHIILSKPGSSEVNIKPKGPVDPYANESIPAMQLLSLMDGSTPSNRFNIGPSKPFAPCGYHPRYSATLRRDFLTGSLFQRQNRLAASVGETSGQSSGRHQFAFSGQPQERDQSYPARYSGCLPYTGKTSDQGKGKQKATVGANDSSSCPQRFRGRRLPSQINGVSTAREVQPRSIISGKELNCVINLNPAEYFLPDDDENDFTIHWVQLRIPKRKYSRDIMRDGGKRQKTAKPKAGKEQPENSSS